MLFQEVQQMRQNKIIWLVFVLYPLVALMILWGTFSQLVLDKPFGDNPTSDLGLILTNIFTFVIMGGIFWLLMAANLTTEVRTDGIYVRYPPFVRKFQAYHWDDLAEIYVRKYRPIWEYGGWGWRAGLMGKGQAYNIRGNQGLQFVMQNGKRLLIGTQKPDELQEAIEQAQRDNQKRRSF